MVVSPQHRYAAFISYAHVDDKQARRLHRWLETYRLPKQVAREIGRSRLGRVFLDRSELATSTDLSLDIAAALTDAEALIVLCSPASAASRWVNEEIRRFRSLGKGERIFCLILSGDPSVEGKSPFPPALREGDEPFEPLAADARVGKDGPAAARLKLLAGLVGVPFDALRRREQARRQRRMLIALGVITALLAVMTYLAISATLAQREAERQRDRALRTANFMREIFVGAQPVDGTPVTVEAMLERASIDTLRSVELRRVPETRGALLTTLAQVYISIGDLQRAERLLRAASGNIVAPIDRLQAAVVAASIAIRQTRYANVLKLAAGARRISAPGNIDSEILVTQLDLLAGQAAFALHDERAGRAALLAARQRALGGETPDRDAAAYALTALGVGEAQVGKLDEAAVTLHQAIRERLALGQQDHPDRLVALMSLGAVMAKRGDPWAAEGVFRQALASQTRVLGPDHYDTATTRGNLGRALVEQRRFAEAIAALEPSVKAILAQLGPQAAMLANMYDSLGLAQAGLGRHSEAALSFAAGLRVAQAQQSPKDVELLADWAESACAIAQAPAGLARLQQARDALARHGQTEGWRRARLDDVAAGCLLAQGRRAAALPLVTASAAAIDARWPGQSLFRTASLRHRRAVAN